MFEKYTLDNQPIGKGATSLVFFGLNERNERVVIKKVNNKRQAELESDLLKSLPVYKHIITWLDFLEEEQTGYIVLEYHQGGRLGFFKKGIIHDQKCAVQITISILEGLKVIHQQGILHCDITPHNILIYNNDPKTVKIIDFGSAVRTNDSGEYIGNHRGATRWYRPPELKKQKHIFFANLTYNSDLYSAACVCLYMLTGFAPYRKKQSCKQIPDQNLRKILWKATRKNSLKRFQSAQEFIDALRPFS